MRTLGHWVTVLVTIVAGGVAAFALNAWIQTAWLPYNTEGRYFDAAGGIVHTDAEPQFWAVVGCAAVVLACSAGFLRWKLRRR